MQELLMGPKPMDENLVRNRISTQSQSAYPTGKIVTLVGKPGNYHLKWLKLILPGMGKLILYLPYMMH